MFGFSYWMIPIFSALVWIGTLLGMLLHWIAVGRPIYASMSGGQTIAYISDVGAQELKPLFIAGSAVTVVTFTFVFILEKWLRHRGRLAHHTTLSEKIFSFLSGICSIAGAAGLIFLSIFDTLRHPTTHIRLLIVFIIGYLLTAIFVCAEYQRLGMQNRQYRLLRASFWLKLSWVLLFLGMTIAFGLTQKRGMPNIAAILEWVIGFLFAIFVATFAIDFLPAIRTRGDSARFPTKQELEMAHQSHTANNLGGPAFGDDANYGTPHRQHHGRNF